VVVVAEPAAKARKDLKIATMDIQPTVVQEQPATSPEKHYIGAVVVVQPITTPKPVSHQPEVLVVGVAEWSITVYLCNHLNNTTV
jgi:hypothetical protein